MNAPSARKWFPLRNNPSIHMETGAPVRPFSFAEKQRAGLHRCVFSYLE